MRDGRGWVAGFVFCFLWITIAGCGASDDASSTDDSTTSSIGATGPLRDGTYVLTGTQDCKSAVGPGANSSPLFDNSTLTIAGDRATVYLRNDSLAAPVTTDGDSFQIRQVFDLQGNPLDRPAGTPLGQTDVVLELNGTSNDGGQTISGTGGDMGVNCQYTFTGRWDDGSPSTTQLVTDVCNPTDAAGSIYEHWAHFDATFGEVRVVSSCAEPWARVNFVNHDDTLVHWNGSYWELSDPAQYCASTTRPPEPRTEQDQAARIYYSTCASAAEPSTTTTAAPAPTAASPSNASTGPCTKSAVQAGLRPGILALTEPRCDGVYAIVEVSLGEDAESTSLLRWNGDAWVATYLNEICGAADLPPMVTDLCLHPVG